MKVAIVMKDGTREIVEGPVEEIVDYCAGRPVADWFIEGPDPVSLKEAMAQEIERLSLIAKGPPKPIHIPAP